MSAQVFMSETVKPDEIAGRRRNWRRRRPSNLGLPSDAVRVGKVFPLARSFSVTANEADVFRSIVGSKDVKSIFEFEQPDILPKPLNRRSDP